MSPVLTFSFENSFRLLKKLSSRLRIACGGWCCWRCRSWCGCFAGNHGTGIYSAATGAASGGNGSHSYSVATAARSWGWSWTASWLWSAAARSLACLQLGEQTHSTAAGRSWCACWSWFTGWSWATAAVFGSLRSVQLSEQAYAAAAGWCWCGLRCTSCWSSAT